jgi:predicted aldo/keto reductase-like oxidoreductase
MEGLNPHQAALRYVLNDPNVAAAVPGVTTIEQIEECAAVMGTAVSRKDMDQLQEYQAFLKGRICTLCGGCTGECPYGVPYGDYLRAAMYHDGYQDDDLARETIGNLLTARNPVSCAECPSCSIVCRRGLDVRAQVQRALKIFQA